MNAVCHMLAPVRLISSLKWDRKKRYTGEQEVMLLHEGPIGD